ncbi:SDR family NAD(P)-dependent oxidoreductase [Amycolatopsis eburnea]|uniref:SDR family NAD(P)-dependent oxidoreductase n=1 Tax=Amycolatopsis eburnea TaxID=2267691 RepID=A0A3R9DB68_9PSEU|nr:SDR family NAD(P)-dependent oxidoreductase [Amycolatopsis eburnea]
MVLSSKDNGRTVVVTGASTGLGRTTALTLAAAGFRVVAGVRRAADGEALLAESAALTYAIIDVTDERTIAAAAGALDGPDGVWGLVNNAGICVSAPVECLSSADLRRQLETNVIGTLAVTRAFLPLLRTAGGRVVNVTSGLGALVVPYLGAYAMAQFAKEAMSDALRRELAPAGVGVSVVRPGAIMTPIWDKVSRGGNAVLAAAPEPVARRYRGTFLRFLAGNEAGARASETRPEDVAAAIHHALSSARPKTRYPVGPDATRGARIARLLPDRLIDRMFTGVVTPTEETVRGAA